MKPFPAGVFFGAMTMAIVLALLALPQWQDLIIDTKIESCQNLNSRFIQDGNNYAGGHCESGNTIVYRFKN